jgi:hypothetical protein
MMVGQKTIARSAEDAVTTAKLALFRKLSARVLSPASPVLKMRARLRR